MLAKWSTSELYSPSKFRNAGEENIYLAVNLYWGPHRWGGKAGKAEMVTGQGVLMLASPESPLAFRGQARSWSHPMDLGGFRCEHPCVGENGRGTASSGMDMVQGLKLFLFAGVHGWKTKDETLQSLHSPLCLESGVPSAYSFTYMLVCFWFQQSTRFCYFQRLSHA